MTSVMDAIQIATQEFPDIIDDPVTQKFIARTKKHVDLVNKYAARIGQSYPEHDSSKFTLLLPGYRYMIKPANERTLEETKALDLATYLHITQASHHAEYWTKDKEGLKAFTRANPNPTGVIDCTDMPQECIDEMICDWCATAEEKNGNPFDWFESVNGIRWKFNESQQMYIRLLIDKVWNG